MRISLYYSVVISAVQTQTNAIYTRYSDNMSTHIYKKWRIVKPKSQKFNRFCG